MDSMHPDRRHVIEALEDGEIDLAEHLEDTEVLRSRERFQRLDIAGRGFPGPHVSLRYFRLFWKNGFVSVCVKCQSRKNNIREVMSSFDLFGSYFEDER